MNPLRSIDEYTTIRLAEREIRARRQIDAPQMSIARGADIGHIVFARSLKPE